jgi:superfamily II DNA or RNA helicase
MAKSRGFTRTQKLLLFMRSLGRCMKCGIAISVDAFEADHIIPWSKGGKTTLSNGQALCQTCNRSKNSTMTVPYQNHLPAGWELRKWQEEFITRFVTEAIRQCTLAPSDIQAFILHAFPGSGKSLAQALAAKVLYAEGYIDYVVMCVPSKNLKEQMKDDAAQVGLVLDNKKITDRAEYGLVVTYQQLGYRDQESGKLVNAEFIREICEKKRVMVCADEMHHIGAHANWGEGFRLAFEERTVVRLMTSGTPFRSDGTTIPWVRYRKKKIDLSPPHAYSYGYGKSTWNTKYSALNDKVVRDVSIVPWDGKVSFTVERKQNGVVIDSNDYALRLSDNIDALFPDEIDLDTGDKIVDNAKLRKMLKAKRREAVIECGTDDHPYGTDYVRNVLLAADKQLNECRRAHNWAGGLIVCNSIKHAQKVAAALEHHTGEKAVVVTSEDGASNRLITNFRKNTTADRAKWIISVGKISEGVDIKHLRVCVYLSVIQAPLRWTQILGRILRTEDSIDWDLQTAYLYQYDDGIEHIDEDEDGSPVAGSVNIKLYAETLLQERWVTLESKDKKPPPPKTPCSNCGCIPCAHIPGCPEPTDFVTTHVHTHSAEGVNSDQIYGDERYANSRIERCRILAARLNMAPVKIAYLLEKGGEDEWKRACGDD